MTSSLNRTPIIDSNSTNIVNVYLRNYSKQAMAIPVSSPIKSGQLLDIVSNKVRSQKQKIAVFANGLRLTAQKQIDIELRERSIIHIVQLDRTNLQYLIVYFNYPQSFQPMIKVVTTSKSQIRSVLQNHICQFYKKSQKQIFLAYLGKPINIYKSFQEELIEHQCEVMVLQFKQKVKHFETIRYSQQSKVDSMASTVMLGMPAMGPRSLKNSTKTSFVPPLQKLQSIHESSNPSKKNHQLMLITGETPKSLEISAAPGQYLGFDPNSKNSSLIKKIHEKSLETTPMIKKQKQQNHLDFTAPPTIKQNDLLFMANDSLDEIQNFSAGAVQQSKQKFLKKKNNSNIIQKK